MPVVLAVDLLEEGLGALSIGGQLEGIHGPLTI
jgi:hypothetical protein